MDEHKNIPSPASTPDRKSFLKGAAVAGAGPVAAVARGAMLAGSTVVFMPTVVVFLFMQRFFLRGVLQGSIKE